MMENMAGEFVQRLCLILSTIISATLSLMYIRIVKKTRKFKIEKKII